MLVGSKMYFKFPARSQSLTDCCGCVSRRGLASVNVFSLQHYSTVGALTSLTCGRGCSPWYSHCIKQEHYYHVISGRICTGETTLLSHCCPHSLTHCLSARLASRGIYRDVHTVCSWDEKAAHKIQKALEEEILKFTENVQTVSVITSC